MQRCTVPDISVPDIVKEVNMSEGTPGFGHKFPNGLGPASMREFYRKVVGDPFLMQDSEGNIATGISLEGLREASRREWGITHKDEVED